MSRSPIAPAGPMLLQRLVYHAQGQDVRDVWVDGEPVMENRRLTCCDEGRILADADAAFATLAQRLGPERMERFTRNDGLYSLCAVSAF